MVVIQILYFIIICPYFQAHKYYFPYNLCIKLNIPKKEEGSIILEIYVNSQTGAYPWSEDLTFPLWNMSSAQLTYLSQTCFQRCPLSWGITSGWQAGQLSLHPEVSFYSTELNGRA